ncbi:hypothetical protein H6G89_23750 [Oscillatoria sp. FACHB-1407]|uniref:DUF7219 family protein n=1 Tax=Oscillatoria sp. FACHB-1407 TaxID=2692847 RepID=UPI001689FFCA|nr:hypothetical protein [Oscillatoria sp. FACHB-1407]MBD2464021.1 hypothetical protein [Oscillatoria sp. FACHB-1407]
MADKSQFLYPHIRYHGEVKPENLVFNANLQEFSQRVSLICGLESNGKLTPNESFLQIKALWEDLQRSKEELGIGQNPFQA